MREENNTVINWKITTTRSYKMAASKVQKNEASEPAERNERGTSTKKTQVKKHVQQHQEKHDNDYETKKEMTPEKTQEQV